MSNDTKIKKIRTVRYRPGAGSRNNLQGQNQTQGQKSTQERKNEKIFLSSMY